MTASDLPLVSIGMPVFNGGARVGDALRSALAQTYPNLEILVSDNGSTDDTPEVVRSVAGSDPRVVVHRHDENRGGIWNWSFVLGAARGEYFAWLAHDDVLEPEFVARTADVLRGHADASVCHNHYQPVGPDGLPIGPVHVGTTATADDPRRRVAVALRAWDLHAAIYGLVRRDLAVRSLPFPVVLSADLVYTARLAYLGKVLDVPHVLQRKSVPAPGTAYRTDEQALAYLHPEDPPRPPLLARFRTLAACARVPYDLDHDLRATLALVPTAVAAYVLDGHGLADARRVLVRVRRAVLGRRRPTG